MENGEITEPKDCLRALEETVENGDYINQRKYAVTLEKWVKQGGLVPEISREQFLIFVQSIDMLAERRIRELGL